MPFSSHTFSSLYSHTLSLSLVLRLFSLFLFTFFANQAKSEVFYPFVLSFSSPVICSLQLHVEYHSGVALEAAHAKVRQEEEEEEEEEKEEERTLENTISVSCPSPLLSFFKINSNMSCSSLPPLSLYSWFFHLFYWSYLYTIKPYVPAPSSPSCLSSSVRIWLSDSNVLFRLRSLST